jgi:tRNA threonylcarbamoyladenosine biosynthesis protein TsaB
MKVLAVDTCFGACSVAILDGEKILAHRFERMERGHAEALAPMVSAAMDEAAIGYTAIERLAVTTGPGTFTGQRVGLAFMRGLRIALKVPLVGITSLGAMSAQARDEAKTKSAAAIHDARRDEVYFALNDENPAVLLFSEAVQHVEAAARSADIALAGTAAKRVAGTAKPARIRLTEIAAPDAIWVARLARSAPVPDAVPKPLYLRAPDAKIPGPPK